MHHLSPTPSTTLSARMRAAPCARSPMRHTRTAHPLPLRGPLCSHARIPMHASTPRAPSHAPHIADRCTVPSACTHAAPPRTMPPLRPQNLRKLVRKLAQPGEQLQALAVIKEEGCCEREDFHFRAAIVAVVAIPLLVPLLGPGSPRRRAGACSKNSGESRLAR
jgi:hypothetical protein